MNENIMKIGILGCGRVCDHYIDKILKKDKIRKLFKVIACCDLDPRKSNRIATILDCKSFQDINEFLDSNDMDMVLVLTKSGQHYEHAKVCIENNFNVLVEKPIALRVEHANELLKISEVKNKFCCSVFQNRLNPAVVVTKEAFQNNRFGKLVSVSVRLRWCRLQDYYDDGWHGTWSQDGGVTNQQAIHHVDALTWICGPVKTVSALSAQRANRLEAEDTLVAALELENGGLATLELTTAARPRDIEASITITGTNGVVEIGGIALNKIQRWDFIDKSERDSIIVDSFSEEVENGYGISHYRQLEKIHQCYLGKKFEDIPFQVGSCLHTLRLIHSIYGSVETGEKVDLSKNIYSTKLGK